MINFLNDIGVNTQPQFWISVVQIIWINVLLSGDNAIVIALACRNLPQKQRLTGMVLGTGVALLLRLVFATIVSTLMLLPYVKIAGGAALLWIAVKLLSPNDESGNGDASSHSLWRAVKLVAVADVVMSLDNVIAVAAVADGSLALLVFGLGVSIPAIVAGANIIMAMLNYFPLIIWAGAGLLGWIAGDVIASDPIIADYAASFGAGAPAKIKLIFAIAGMAGTVGVCLISRARLRAPRLDY
jgi:YjbE family integral membrane protein